MSNYIDYRREGYGVWEVWSDDPTRPGFATPSTTVAPSGEVVPVRFVVRREAAEYARTLAQHHPDHRFKVVLSDGS